MRVSAWVSSWRIKDLQIGLHGQRECEREIERERRERERGKREERERKKARKRKFHTDFALLLPPTARERKMIKGSADTQPKTNFHGAMEV